MAKGFYNWKRFWAKREGHLNLSDGGFLFDPDSELGKLYNPDVHPFTAIDSAPCLILLGEPGIGKSTAIKFEYNGLEISTPTQRLLFDLRSVGSEAQLNRKLFDSNIFRNWKSGNHSLHLFLDSLDECLLRVDTVANLFIEELRDCPISRLSLRIACRTFEWPSILENGLIELWGTESFAAYELTPLRRLDVREAAENNNCNADKFLQEIDRVEAAPLAIKPVTLEFLLNSYARSGQLPNTRLELYKRGCLILCEEQNQSRRSANIHSDLSPKQKMAVASRIAAVSIYSNKYAVWSGPDLGNVPEEDITIQQLSGGAEYFDGVQFDVSDHAIRETIATGLFSSRGPERMGWAHQTYAEYLAATYLIDKGMTLQQIMSLIAHPSDPERRLVPQLHETAAWLASIDQDVFLEILKTDPEILLRSDIDVGDNQARKNLVEALLKFIETEKMLDVPWQHNTHYKKLVPIQGGGA